MSDVTLDRIAAGRVSARARSLRGILTLRRATVVFLLAVVLTFAGRAAVVSFELSSLSMKHPGTTLLYDASRYHHLATVSGTPYRDFQVEVPPVALGAIEALNGPTTKATAVRLAWSQLLLELVVVAALAVGWSRRTALLYLVLSAPLAMFVYFRIDMLSVALTVVSMALVRRGRERAGGAILAAAVLTKIWPVFLAPMLLVRRRTRAAAWFAGSLGLGVAAWVAWAGFDGPRQVLTFRGATGWQIESVVGAVVRAVTHAIPVHEGGAMRVGAAPGAARLALFAATVIVVGLVWTRARARRDPIGSEGVAALTAVAAVLVFAPLLSPQYLLWLAPFAAIAAAGGERTLGGLVVLIAALTSVFTLIPSALTLNAGNGEALLWTRNAALIALMVIGLIRLGPAAGEPARAPRRRVSDERGIISPLVAILLGTVLLAIAALGIDLGFGYANKAKVSKAADAGALAAGADLPGAYSGTFSCGAIPGSGTSKLANDAGTYACNNAAGSVITVTSPFQGSANIVNVKVCKTQGTFFAKVIGISTLTSCDDATAARQASTSCVVVPTSVSLSPHRRVEAFALAMGAKVTPVPCPWERTAGRRRV